MRILANFSKKVSTGNYENENYSVTIECETEFNDVAEVADYLFQEAQAAISRQLGDSSSPKLAIKLPKVLKEKAGGNVSGIQKPGRNGDNGKKADHSGNGSKSGNGVSLMTDAQRRFLFKLMAEQGIDEEQAHQVLREEFNVTNLKEATKSQASKLINQLVQSKEQVSA